MVLAHQRFRIDISAPSDPRVDQRGIARHDLAFRPKGQDAPLRMPPKMRCKPQLVTAMDSQRLRQAPWREIEARITCSYRSSPAQRMDASIGR